MATKLFLVLFISLCKLIGAQQENVLAGFNVSAYTVNEGERVTLAVVLNTTVSSRIIFHLVTEDGSANAPGDYEPINITVSIPAGGTEHIVNLLIRADNITENPESFTVQLLNPSEGVILEDSMATVNIMDLDVATVVFNPVEYTVAENAGIINFIIELLTSSERQLSITLNVSAGSAQEGESEDYRSFSMTEVIISAGTDAGQRDMAPVIIVNDTNFEPTEYFTVSIIPEPAERIYTIEGQGTATAFILDDDSIIFGFDQTAYSVMEGTPSIAITVRLMNGMLGGNVTEVTTTLRTEDGTAMSSGEPDFVTETMNLTFTTDNAQEPQTVVIGILDDSHLETNEQFNCTLTLAGTNDPSIQVDPALATVTIIDNDNIAIGFNQTLYEVSENEPFALLFVTIIGGTLQREVVVDVSTRDDTALGGSDYSQSVQQELLFDRSSLELSVAISITDDSQFELPEQFFVRLSTVDPNVMLNPSDAVVRIQSDDVVTFGFHQRQYMFLEGVSDAEVCVDRNGSTALTVNVTVAGTIQSEIINRTLSFSASVFSICINFTVNDDNIALQAPEEYNLVLLQPEDPQLQVEINSTRIIIIDDDVVVIGFNPTEYNVSEGAGVVTLMTERRGATAQPLAVNISTNDFASTDYESPLTEVIFSPSLDELATLAFNISITDDTAVEPTEQFEVFLNTSQEAVLIEREANSATVNIIDDDNVVIGFNQTLYEFSESELPALISVTLLNGTLQREAIVTLSITENTAKGGRDFVPLQPQQLTFDAGTTYNTVAVNITNDESFEMDEQFYGVLSTVDLDITLSPAQTTIRILNDDVINIGFRQRTYTILEGAGIAFVCVDKRGITDLAINVTINGSIQAEAIEQVVVFSSTVSSVCINLFINDDSIALEPPEETTLELLQPENPSLQLQINTTKIIIVDDDAVTVGFNPTEYNVSEGDRVVTLMIERRGATAQPIVVTVTTNNVTITDLTFSSSLEELLVQGFNFPIIDDTVVESTEQVKLFLNTSQEGVVIGADADVATVNIFNDDSFLVDIGFQMTEYTTSERSGSLTIVITLNGSIATTFNVSIQGIDGTAIARLDYEVISTQLTITPGSTGVPVDIAVYNDSTFDAIGFKNFSLVLSTEENAARIITDTTVINVFDDDFSPPAVDITVPASVQDGQPATFRCTVNASSANITVFWLDENDDIIGSTGPQYSVIETREFESQYSSLVVSTLTVASFSVSDNLCNPFSCVGIVGNPVVQYSTTNDVTNLQLQLPPINVNQLVYSRIGDLLTLSCLPTENATTAIWFSVDNVNGIQAITECSAPDFSLSPPDIISFNATQYALNNFGQNHSLTEASFQIVCTFSSGENNSGIDFPVNFTVLLQQERIRMALGSSPYSRSNNSVLNNTIINSGFMSAQRENPGSGMLTSSGDEMMGLVSSPLTIDCTTTQGDHMPYWITPTNDLNQVQLVVDDYTARLEFYDVSIEGAYTCISNLSGQLKKFVLTPDNPYLRAVSPRELSVTAGESVTLEFSVAVDSNGLIWSTDRVNFKFNSIHGEESLVHFTVADQNFPHNFIYVIERVDRSHAGVYTAAASTQICPSGDCYREVSINVTVITYCPEEFNGGIFWPRTQSDLQVSFSCGRADLFERETMTTRQCDADGVWSVLDLTTCTLKEKNLTFILTWFVLEEEGGLPPERINSTELEREIMMLFNNRSIQVNDISLRLNISLSGTAVTVEIILPSANQSEQVMRLLDDFSSSTMLGNYLLNGQSQSYILINGSTSCACNQSESALTLCVGSPISPCNCSVTSDCKCQTSYVGNGVKCTTDPDGDGYPDNPLDASICGQAEEASINYCRKDNCPTIPNPEQNPDDCSPCPRTGFKGCCSETDVWGIRWPNRLPGSGFEQRCPGGLEVTMGSATRVCDANGEWGPPDVLQCTSPEFIQLQSLARSLSTLSPEQQLIQATELTQRLIIATEPLQRNNSLLPNDLGASARVVDAIIEVNENNNSTNESIIEVFNNVLDDQNREGWRVLQSAGFTSDSELLLNSAERYAMVTAMSVNISEGEQRNQTVRQSRTNIVVVGEQYREPPSIDLQFPLLDDLVNYTSSENTSTITIPSSLVEERLREAENGDNVPVFFVLLRNLPMGIFVVDESIRALEPCTGQNINTLGASDVIAAQVGTGSNNITFSSSLQESPIHLNFSFESNPDSVLDSYRCVFWNFSDPVGDGSWVTEGVMTNNSNQTDSVTTVRCSSTHLTSFAVLVDVAGGLQQIGEAERFALQAVSYIGCAISIIFLTITVLFFLWQGYHQRRLPDTKKERSVQNFIHLNLSTSLLLAFIVYVLGVETADGNSGGCTFVAAVLHYLFLCAFCWMLCEGVLLYLLLRVVFSEMAKMWWPFMLIGYVTPLPIVAITVGIRYEHYGVRDECGGLLYCWLSVEKGTIFGFVAPMLAIILLNVFFLVMALITLASARKRQIKRKKDGMFKARQELGRALLLATLVLLPLLGLTWAFGILTINANSTAFAWLFTIFNSLQGLFIFFFHVVRSDKIWGKVSPKLQLLKSKVTSVTGSKMEDMSTGGTASSTMTKGKSPGISTLPQDPYSTLGRPDRGKKKATHSSSINDSLNSPTKSDYELKSDFHPVSEFTSIANETETKIDLGSTEISNDPDPAEPDSTTKATDEVQATLLKENTSLKENDKLKLNSNVDRADRNVPRGGDTSDQGENCEISASVIENPSASEEGKGQMDADTAKENTVDKSCKVIENLKTTTEESPKLNRNGGDKNQGDINEKVTML